MLVLVFLSSDTSLYANSVPKNLQVIFLFKITFRTDKFSYSLVFSKNITYRKITFFCDCHSGLKPQPPLQPPKIPTENN